MPDSLPPPPRHAKKESDPLPGSRAKPRLSSRRWSALTTITTVGVFATATVFGLQLAFEAPTSTPVAIPMTPPTSPATSGGVSAADPAVPAAPATAAPADPVTPSNPSTSDDTNRAGQHAGQASDDDGDGDGDGGGDRQGAGRHAADLADAGRA